jgi:hypothetical protein
MSDPKPPKVGVDDYLVRYGREAFQKLLDEAEPFDPDSPRYACLKKKAGPAAPKADAADGTPDGDGFEFQFITSAEFARRTYTLKYLVEDVLVADQPGVIGGGFKTLKTSIGCVDLALSLGTARPFLGVFRVPVPVRVGVLSGESGEAVLQEAALRIAKAKGLDLANANVMWDFKLPQLANATHLSALKRAVVKHGIQVLLIDPMYLCLLAGCEGLRAENFYHTGPLLMGVCRLCLGEGCTPLFVHHFKTGRQEPYGEPGLEDLAYSGIKEYARQWVLLGRREKYVPGSGEHRLWMSVGGSAGHTGLWGLDVGEGVAGKHFDGRFWRVGVHPAGDARRDVEYQKEQERVEKKEREEHGDQARLLGSLDKLDPHRRGCGYQQVRRDSKVPRDRFRAAFEALLDEGIVEDCKVMVETGKGARRKVNGLRRTAV